MVAGVAPAALADSSKIDRLLNATASRPQNFVPMRARAQETCFHSFPSAGANEGFPSLTHSLTHLKALRPPLEEEEERTSGELVARGVDQALRLVRPRLQVGAVEAEEGADDGVEPEQGQPEEEKEEEEEEAAVSLEVHCIYLICAHTLPKRL